MLVQGDGERERERERERADQESSECSLNAKGSPISHEQSMGIGRWDFNTGIIQYHLVLVVMWFPLEFLAVICDGLLLLSVITVLTIVHSLLPQCPSSLMDSPFM
jgi:hypothetical protein